jgi:hypothetical protein
MRKEYNAPIAIVENVQFQQHLLQDSLKKSGDYASTSSDGSSYSNSLSRRGGFSWDDEE